MNWSPGGAGNSAGAIAAVPSQFATTNKVLPIEFDPAPSAGRGDGQPRQLPRAGRSALADGLHVVAKIADAEQIDKLLAKYYQAAAEEISQILSNIQDRRTSRPERTAARASTSPSLAQAADSNEIRKLINLVLLQAIKDKASDIHFEPFEGEFKMRYRIDGVLYEMMPPPAHIAPAISSRIKVMANLDIAERRLPQDGRIELNVNNQQIDLRVNVLPTMFGESSSCACSTAATSAWIWTSSACARTT
jgi:type IV pilus assembly protein PilB